MSAFTAFTGPLNIQYDPHASSALGADHWRVTEGFQYFIGSRREWITVPAGYLTDGASVPRVFWALLPPWGAYGQAAVVHDLLCEYLSVVEQGKPKPITRARADQIFDEAMGVLDVPSATRLMLNEGLSLYRSSMAGRKPGTRPEKRLLEASWKA